MIISNFFKKHKTPGPQFAPGLFLGLLAIFMILGQSKPIVGLVGIGTLLVVTGTLVELNRTRIWETYRKSYRKQRGLKGLFSEPNHVYYTINVMFLWPFILLLGVLCLFSAYTLA